MNREILNFLKEQDIEVIALSGRLGSGKNYIAENILYPLLPPKETIFLSLADHFKVDVIVKDDIRYERVYHKKDEESRVKLQTRGTEEGRDIYGEYIWINMLMTWMRVHVERGIKRFIISDCRFINELQFFNELGATTIKVLAPNRNRDAVLRESNGDEEKYKKISSHPSETQLEEHPDLFTYVIHNDYLDAPKIPFQISKIVQDLYSKTTPDTLYFVDVDDTLCLCRKYYDEVLVDFKDYIWKELYPNLRKVDFDIVYSRFMVETHTDDYHRRPFNVHQFYESLLSIYNTMVGSLSLFTRPVDIEYLKVLGYRVFERVYEPIVENIQSLKNLSKNKRNRIVLYTKGDIIVQTTKIVSLGLSSFDREIVAVKSPDILHYLMNKYKANKYIVIGDSFVNDIEPALTVGIRAFHLTNNPVNTDNTNYMAVEKFEEIVDCMENEPISLDSVK
jgi:FMN phosphatase YigB (HAD superfamily)